MGIPINFSVPACGACLAGEELAIVRMELKNPVVALDRPLDTRSRSKLLRVLTGAGAGFTAAEEAGAVGTFTFLAGEAVFAGLAGEDLGSTGCFGIG